MSRGSFLIFGAYGGIGSALARRLTEEGHQVCVSGRDPERLGALADELDAIAVPADATAFGEVDAVVDATVDKHGRLDGVASCVGSLLLKPAHLTRYEEWLSTLHTNLTSAFAVVRSAARAMTQQGHGSVVLVSTAAASIGLPNHEAIAAAKGGVDALVRSAAATYGRAGVRVNAVAPGLVETPLTAKLTANDTARATSLAMHALGRLGRSNDVAGAIAWLLSPEASWTTGQTIGIDGGLAQVRST